MGAATTLVLTIALTGMSGTDAPPARPTPTPAAPTVLRLHLDPAGSDARDGASPARAVATLARVQQIIAAARPSTDVEVRIKQGVYPTAPLTWNTYVPGRSISFLPADHRYGGDLTGIAGRPVFRGTGTAGFWFRAEPPPSGLPPETSLRFYYLQVEQYASGGIMFDGGTARSAAGLLGARTGGVNGNTVYGMRFRAIGSKHVPAAVGYGAVDLINSRRNIIEKNEFTDIENRGTPDQAALVHGVYLAHLSSDNIIRRNTFTGISGDPVRTRNASGRNQISGNTFVRAGSKAYFSDWYQRQASPTSPRECASVGNKFHGNTLTSGYRGPVQTWAATPGSTTSPGGPGCGTGPVQRVTAWDNHAG
ncbi:right-handed parallel beta-helix repeat-containing protein [Actinomadura flavalba]|uniref:right-handed parallel beta-helix repeat-containing protein n=1 Tax=Actinomadura flavalba TaxID=1120938 RepID=UPI000373F15C|nr:right-handed parallel beta-helix repeat-containing protein [Actinomadura flavalba]